VSEAERFERTTLEGENVTGAQIAVLQRGNRLDRRFCFARPRYGPADGSRHDDPGCMIQLTNSDNGELASPPLLDKILGDAVTP